MNDMKKMQKARAEALEAALDVMAKAGRASGAERIELDPENVLRYAKFILGGTKKKRGDLAADPAPVKAEEDLDPLQVQAEWRERRLEREKAPEPAEEPASPVGEDPGDRGVLTQWAEAIRQQDAAREAAREAAALEASTPPPSPRRPEEIQPGESLQSWAKRLQDRTDERERELEAAALEAEPEVHKPEDGLTITREDGTRSVVLGANASSADKRIAEETMGLVPGALDEDLTITNEGTFLPDGSPAEVALREVEVGKTNDSAGAKNWVLQEGVRVGCPECTAEADRRKARDESLKRGRSKLAGRRRDGWPSSDLDEDELLAVAGSELYPAMDEEPLRKLKIRNRKGEVRSFRSVAGATGWTFLPGDPWSLHLAWTSSEMVRRGPWHVV